MKKHHNDFLMSGCESCCYVIRIFIKMMVYTFVKFLKLIEVIIAKAAVFLFTAIMPL